MSRLLVINILSLILLLLVELTAHAQSAEANKKQLKTVRREIRKMSLAEKINSFVLKDNDPYRVVDIDTITEINGLPLPSLEAIGQSAVGLPEWLAELLGADYIFKSKVENQAILLGLDSIGRILRSTPYFTEEEISEGILGHDFILPVSDRGKLYLATLELDKSERKNLNEHLEHFLISEHTHYPAVSSPEDLEKRYLEWVIKVYASNKWYHAARTTGNQGASTEKAENWLAEIIYEQITKGVYSENGDRLKLAQGLPQMFDTDVTYFDIVDSLISYAIRNEAIPGCQLLVAKDGYVIFNKAYGYQTYDSLRPVNHSTIYDLASLTKVLATTQALMQLTDAEKYDPAKKLSTYLPYLVGTNKKDITGIEVLSHYADLYPYYPFWKKARDEFELNKMNGPIQAGRELWVESWVADSILSWAAKSDLLSERSDTVTQRQYFYSDVGFYFFEDLVERLSGRTLNLFLADNLFGPTEIDLVFRPLNIYPDSVIAPTEMDKLLRNELVQGYVHDRNAALMGGVAGQAGLFGNARNIAKLMQIHLDSGRYDGEQYFSSEVLIEYGRRHFTNNRRGLGWDKPALPAGRPGLEPDGPVSKYASDATFGHTGFTGGMVWADPKENLIFVFLSNRVYPSVDNNKLIEMNIRTRIQDLVYRALGYQ